MITDTDTIEPSVRLKSRQKIQTFLKGQPAIGLVTEQFGSFAFEELTARVSSAAGAAAAATGADSAAAQAKLITYAAMARDLRYAVCGRKAMFATGFHSAMVRAHKGGVAGAKMGLQ